MVVLISDPIHTLLHVLCTYGRGVIVVVFSFVGVIIVSQKRAESILSVEDSSIQTMNIILQTIRNANSINTPASGTASTSVSLATSIHATNPTVIALSGNKITITEGAGLPVDLTPASISISNLSFSNFGIVGTRGSIRLQFDVSFVSNSGTPENIYSKTIYGTATIK